MQRAPAIAQVAVELPVQAPLDYRIPVRLQTRCQVGQRVLVPLGKRHIQGYIVGLAHDSTVTDLKELLEVLDDAPLLTPEILRLTRWMADYYLCPWGQVLKAAVPAAFRVRSSPTYALTSKAQDDSHVWPEGNAGRILHYLAQQGPQRRQELSRKLGMPHPGPLLRRLEEAGLLQMAQQRLLPKARQRLVTVVRLCIPIAQAQDMQQRLQRRAPNQAAVLQRLLEEPQCELAVLRARIPGASGAVKRLVQHTVVELMQVEKLRQVIPAGPAGPEPLFTLNTAQMQALHTIQDRLANPDGVPILIHGVTGSGKTEVYIRAIATGLRLGKSALVLVPEISLTKQLVERFTARFPSDIAVLHSGLSAGERFDEWRRLARGAARIAIGARSAVFAPLPRLGLIIVDEEHDTSYKQEETPRYHGRDVAIVRAHQGQAVVVLGSATPSLESFYRAKQGKYRLLSLPQRVAEKPLPRITIIDQRTQATPNERVISKPLYQAIAACLEQREQCLVLINRRGFASYLQCQDCGFVPQCVRCSVSLTYHRYSRTLKCHYCDFSERAPEVCQGCQGLTLRPFGLGTQQVEETLRTLFPKARLGRMDRDTTRGKTAHQRILQSLHRGDLDILVGTQMIAKGHDYPNITLVGVVSADATLAIPDFRAPERLFQLLTQVAGRAGRGTVPGKVFIQTYRPQHFSVSFAEHHDFLGFYEDEMQRRQEMGYPPHTRLARLILESPQPERVEAAGLWVYTVLQRQIAGQPQLTLLGPAEAPVAKIHHRYRWHLLLKAPTSRLLHRWLSSCLGEVEHNPGALRSVKLSIDVDPITFM